MAELTIEAIRFFHEHAPYSYDTATETPEEGRQRAAAALAEAEAQGRAFGLTFAWEVDQDGNSSEFSDEKPAWQVWVCLALDTNGTVLDVMGAVDLGRDGSPASSPYARVVEAQLASSLYEDLK